MVDIEILRKLIADGDKRGWTIQRAEAVINFVPTVLDELEMSRTGDDVWRRTVDQMTADRNRLYELLEEIESIARGR